MATKKTAAAPKAAAEKTTTKKTAKAETPVEAKVEAKVETKAAEKAPKAAAAAKPAAPITAIAETKTEVVATKVSAAKPAPTREQIARRAFELFVARGGANGNALEDWVRAERELIGA
jgi:hypothetical protein